MANPVAGIAKAVRNIGKGAAARPKFKLPTGPISIPGGPEGAIIPSVPAAIEAPQLPTLSPAELAAKETATQTGADILAHTVTQEGPHQGLQDLASGQIAQKVAEGPTPSSENLQHTTSTTETAIVQAPAAEAPSANGQTEQQSAQPTTEEQPATVPDAKPQTAVRKTLDELNIKPETFDKLLETSEKDPKAAIDAFTAVLQRKAMTDGKPFGEQQILEARDMFYKLKATHFVDSGMPEQYANDRKLQRHLKEEIEKAAKNVELRGREFTPEEEREAKIAILSAYMMKKDFAPPKNILEKVIFWIGLLFSEIDAFFKGMVPQPQQ